MPLSDPADGSSADPVAVSAAPVSPPFEEAGPDGPECAASAGRHAIHIPSARIRRIQQKRLFIPVLYAEESDIYRLIAAATCQGVRRPGSKNDPGGLET